MSNQGKALNPKKAETYRREMLTKSGVNNDKSSRKAWPLLKAREHRQYRKHVRAFIRDATDRESSEDLNAMRSVPVRRQRALAFHQAEPLDVHVAGQHANRLLQTLDHLCRRPYESERDRMAYTSLLAAVVNSRPRIGHDVAERVKQILRAPEPAGVVWFASYVNVQRRRNLESFLRDAPDWAARIEDWLERVPPRRTYRRWQR